MGAGGECILELGQQLAGSWLTVGRLLANCRPTDGQLLADSKFWELFFTITAHSDLVTKARTSVSILIKSDFLLEPELIHLHVHVQPNTLDGPLIRNVHINVEVHCSSFLFKANCICSGKLMKAI